MILYSYIVYFNTSFVFQLLSKARGMIFDKTKMVKNQELQIEALTTQVQSLKDINLITKDLLEIRNSEVKAMEVSIWG